MRCNTHTQTHTGMRLQLSGEITQHSVSKSDQEKIKVIDTCFFNFLVNLTEIMTVLAANFENSNSSQSVVQIFEFSRERKKRDLILNHRATSPTIVHSESAHISIYFDSSFEPSLHTK